VIAVASAGIRYAFFGHSLGALMAFEVARSLRRQQLSEPIALIVSGAEAPDTRDPRRRLSLLGDDALLDALTAFNGIPADLLDQRELMELCLPTTRADFEMVETYRYVPDEPLAIPIDVFAGKTDTHIHLDRVATWKNQTSAPCTVEWFDGDHFFIDAQRDRVLSRLRDILDCRTPAH
jgi:medium-chain acyl-[acyl-carrier-protein] hydrolase